MPLVFVPTPLGNLGDITQRGLQTLEAATLIVAEDTRVATRLLSAYRIAGKPIWSYREFNAQSVTAGILARAATELVAVVSDAGMPGISDPGRALVAAARAEGVAVEVLPGATAFTGAAVLSGFDLAELHFYGFLPRARGERRTTLLAATRRHGASAFYESPARIIDALEDLAEVAAHAPAFVLREYTKLHEQQIAGTAAAILAALERPVRGELVLVIEGDGSEASVTSQATTDAAALDRAIDEAIASGAGSAEIAKRLSAGSRSRRTEIYARIAERKHAKSGDDETGGQPEAGDG